MIGCVSKGDVEQIAKRLRENKEIPKVVEPFKQLRKLSKVMRAKTPETRGNYDSVVFSKKNPTNCQPSINHKPPGRNINCCALTNS